jgi:hypothetical protein
MLSDLIRAMARRDWGAADQLISELDQAGWEGRTQVIGAAFAIAINYRFAENYTADDVARFVAETRSEFGGTEAIPALETEELIRSGLGEVELTDNISLKVAFEVQLLVLGKILQDGNFTEPQLEAFIKEVQKTAARYMQPSVRGRRYGREFYSHAWAAFVQVARSVD